MSNTGTKSNDAAAKHPLDRAGESFSLSTMPPNDSDHQRRSLGEDEAHPLTGTLGMADHNHPEVFVDSQYAQGGRGSRPTSVDTPAERRYSKKLDSSSGSDEADVKPVAEAAPVSFFQSKYALYVLAVTTVVFIENQAARYILAVVNIPMALEVEGFTADGYANLVGPIFTIPFCLAVLPVAYLADRVNKPRMLVVMILWWTASVVLMAFARTFFELAVCRVLLAFAQCSSICVGIISEYFPNETRGVAIGIFNWGLPLGLAMVYGPANALVDSLGYRYAMVWLLGPVGVVFAILVLFTVKHRGLHPRAQEGDSVPYKLQKLVDTDDPSSFQSGSAVSPVAESPAAPVHGKDNGGKTYVTFSEDVDVESNERHESVSEVALKHIPDEGQATPKSDAATESPPQNYVKRNRRGTVSTEATSLLPADAFEKPRPIMGVKEVLKYFFTNPVFVLMSLGGLFRLASGIVMVYYSNNYFIIQHGWTQTELSNMGGRRRSCQSGLFRLASRIVMVYYSNNYLIIQHGWTQTELSKYGSWMPVVGGILGATLGGLASDKASMRWGVSGRVFVLAASSVTAIPLQFAILYLPMPAALWVNMLESALSAMSVPCGYAVIVHICEPTIRVQCISMFLFLTNITGANATVLVPPLMRLFDNDLRAALIVLFPGCTIIGSVFLVAAWLAQVRVSRLQTESMAKRDIPWRTDSFTL